MNVSNYILTYGICVNFQTISASLTRVNLSLCLNLIICLPACHSDFLFARLCKVMFHVSTEKKIRKTRQKLYQQKNA